MIFVLRSVPVRFFIFAASLSFGYSIDRISFDNGTSIEVQVLEQNKSFVRYLDSNGKTNTLYKNEIKKLELGANLDKFYDAAMEETDPDAKINYLVKSTQRFPNERYNFTALIELYLSRGKLPQAGALLTNAALSNPAFDPLYTLYLFRTGEPAKAAAFLSTLALSNRNPKEASEIEILRSWV